MFLDSEFLVVYELCSSLKKSPFDLKLDQGFVANGGDSISAIALVGACRAYGLGLSREKLLKDSSLREILSSVEPVAPTDATFSKKEFRRKLAEAIEKLHELSPRRGRSPSDSGYSSSEASDSHSDDVPMTELQIAFIHSSIKHPGRNFIVHSETYATEHISALKEAWKQVIESEPIFNQDFPQHEALDDVAHSFNWEHVVEEDSPEDQQQKHGIGSFFQVRTVDCNFSKLTWTVHHSLIDGYSAVLLARKVLSIVNGQAYSGPGPSFSNLLIELEQYREENKDVAQAYWNSKKHDLAQARHQMLVPESTLGPETEGSSSIVLDLDGVTSQIQSHARDMGITPTTIFNAAWGLVLSRYCDSDLVSFGAVLCGRCIPMAGALETVGPLLNTLPFMIRIDRSKSVRDFLKSTFDEFVELESYQWTTSDDGFSREFETAVSLQFDFPDCSKATICPVARSTRQEHDVALGLAINTAHEVCFTYHNDRFSKEIVKQIADHFLNALRLLLNPEDALGDVMSRMLTEENLAKLFKFGRCEKSTLTPSITEDLVTLFEKRAREVPESIAIEKGKDQMSYATMDNIASRIALRLSKIIEPGDIVCVYSDRSMYWLCAMFGILKAGGVYCSIDPGLPTEARNKIYGLSGAKVFLVGKSCQLPIVPGDCRHYFTVTSVIEDDAQHVLEHREQARPHNSAYVCFTSGSTGTPKGVLCTHGSLVAFQSSLDVRLFAAPGRKIAHIMSVAFDGSIHEIFSTFCYGATLVLPCGTDPFGHLHDVDTTIMTPSIARLLDPDEFERLKWVYLVGEQVSQAVCDNWASSKQLYNMYGPTEGTCGATIKRLLPQRPVTIGAPNPTTRIYILDQNKALAPLGTIGEIYLAGVQIAKGYLGLPDQTKERFLPDEIWPAGSRETMYKTGDRGYWTKQGEVVCLGRNDRQVKLRGYRLDMDDLEMRIAKAYHAVQAVSVTTRQDQLVAMVQPANIDVAEMQKELEEALPTYAIPHVIAPVEQLPMTPAGKVDYKTVAKATPQPRARSAPNKLTPAEVTIVGSYREVLDLSEDVEITSGSSFIELGGHSLLHMKLLKQLNAAFNMRLSIKTIMSADTVRDLALAVEECSKSKMPTAPTPAGTLPDGLATPIEAEWFEKYRIDRDTPAFNVSISSTLDLEVVDKNKLIDSWNTVLSRHTLLASTYTTKDLNKVYRVLSERVPKVQTCPEWNLETEINRAFDLEFDPPVRILVDDTRLTVVMSHIIADYTALSILLREVKTVYDGGCLDAPPVSLTSIGHVKPSSESLTFWEGYLKDSTHGSYHWLSDHRRSGYSGSSICSTVPQDVWSSCQQLAKDENITLQQLVVASVAASIDPRPQVTDLLIGVPHLNRNTVDEMETFGLFLQPLPIRVSFNDSSPGSFVASVASSCREALANSVPWHHLLDHLNISTDWPNHPLFEIMVTMHDFRQHNDLDVAIPGTDPTFVWSRGSKFKLMCEFTALANGQLVLRLEYDNTIVPDEDIARIQNQIPLAMSLISAKANHESLKKGLAEVEGTPPDGLDHVHGQDFFGKRLRDFTQRMS